MKVSKRAILYLKRRLGKCGLLLLILFTVNLFIVSASAIERISKNAVNSIGTQIDVRVTQVQEQDKTIPLEVYETCRHVDNIASTNRIQHGIGDLQTVNSVQNRELSKERQVMMYSYDDINEDSKFATAQYKITQGKNIKRNEQNKVVVHELFASLNHLSLKDTIDIKTKQGVQSVEIIGLFTDTDTREDDTISILNQNENQMYISQNTFQKLLPKQGYDYISYTVKDPEKSQQLVYNLQEKTKPLSLTYDIADEQYQKMKQYLTQNSDMSSMTILLSVIAGSIIMTLILLLWVKNRWKEIGILLSIGNSKQNIILQFLLEVCVLSCIAIGLAVVTSPFIIEMLMHTNDSIQTVSLVFSSQVEITDILITLCLNSLIVCFALGIAAYPIFRLQPKHILSQHA